MQGSSSPVPSPPRPSLPSLPEQAQSPRADRGMAELCTHLALPREQLLVKGPFLKAVSLQAQCPGWLRSELRSGGEMLRQAGWVG